MAGVDDEPKMHIARAEIRVWDEHGILTDEHDDFRSFPKPETPKEKARKVGIT